MDCHNIVFLICVLGIFFEINPAHRRDLFSSPCHHYVRLSFGPPLKDLDMGLDAIERVLKRAKYDGMHAFGRDCTFCSLCRAILTSRYTDAKTTSSGNQLHNFGG